MQLAHIRRSSGATTLLNLSAVNTDGEDPSAATGNSLVEKKLIIEQLVKQLSSSATGVILEPLSGFDAIEKKDKSCGLLLSLVEQQPEAEPATNPIFYPDWGVEFIRNNYGVAHLKIYYHPNEPLAAKKQQIAAEIFDHCQYEGIDLLLELSLFALDDKKTTLEAFQEAQIAAIADMRNKAHMLALEYPHSALACATLTAELDVPWLLVDRTPDYEEFKEQVRTALEVGASGVAIGQVLWQGMNSENYQQLIASQARDRMIELSRIVDEGVK